MPNLKDLAQDFMQIILQKLGRIQEQESSEHENNPVPKKPNNVLYRQINGRSKKQEIESLTSNEELDLFFIKENSPMNVFSICITGNPAINRVPVMIGRFDHVVSLNLRDNYITDLPWSLVYLKMLEELDVSYNLLTNLPKTLGYLVNLVTLDISANYITALPTEIVQLDRLENIYLTQNKMISPPKKVCEKGVDAIKQALKKRTLRSNVWENYKPWISNKKEDLTTVASLIYLCVNVILKYKVEFIYNPTVPPIMKQGLEETAQERRQKLKLIKCSACSKYFTNEDVFECHMCH